MERIPDTALSAELTELLNVVEPSSIADVLMERAFGHDATDIHFDPTPTGFRIRFRVDGILQDVLPIPQNVGGAVLSRIKIMAGLDITERRIPQDGHISAQRYDGIPRDIRVSSLRTINGERLVLRLMPDPGGFNELESLGFFEDQLEILRSIVKTPNGLLLVVGPVGSGKTTTVYSLLRALNLVERSLVTIEDPVERRLPGANQIQVDAKTGLTFSVALRGVLRQDPNVLAVGEIRDGETARIACRAAMTGILVLSTLHAGSAAAAIEVLREFGVPSMVLSEAVRGIVSQRLIRRVCREAREEYVPDHDTAKKFGLHDGEKVVRGIPTSENFQTGYKGRVAAFEILKGTAAIRDEILHKASAQKITQVAREEGMSSLEESALHHVREHTTSLEELQRIILDMEFRKSH